MMDLVLHTNRCDVKLAFHSDDSLGAAATVLPVAREATVWIRFVVDRG